MGAWGVVYIATNTITGEQYVGQTKQPPHVRFHAHEVSARKPVTKFHRAIADIGYDKFRFEVVASSLTREALNEAEKALIAEYSPVYNTTRGGAGRARVVTEAERARLSEAAKRRWADLEWRARTVQTMRELGAAGFFTEAGRKGGSTGCGARARWVGHTKAVKPSKDKAASIAASWSDPDVRARRLLGMSEANKRLDVRAKRSMATRGRVMSASSVAKTARSKWKPVYCPELSITFLSRSAAAEYIGVGKTAISEALRHTRKVAGEYTLREVGHRL